MLSPTIQRLIDAFSQLPAIGRKSAQRITFSLLTKQPELANQLAHHLQQAYEKTTYCQHCFNLCEAPQCPICVDARRDHATLCVVASSMDLLAIESSQIYQGLYFVLHGQLSPLDNISPQTLHIPELIQRVQKKPIKELILATNLTVEGEATAHFISENCRPFTEKITRIAAGVPSGGDLEYVDSRTLSYAFNGRK